MYLNKEIIHKRLGCLYTLIAVRDLAYASCCGIINLRHAKIICILLTKYKQEGVSSPHRLGV